MSDLGPAIVTGAVAIVVAVAGFVSTGMQAARTQREQQTSALRDEKRRVYAKCMAALHIASDAAAFYLESKGEERPSEELRDEGARGTFKANTDLTVAVSELTLVAPGKMTAMAWKAAKAIADSDEPGHDMEAAYDAVVSLLDAMRADLGVQN
jgi:hypothetical protein